MVVDQLKIIQEGDVYLMARNLYKDAFRCNDIELVETLAEALTLKGDDELISHLKGAVIARIQKRKQQYLPGQKVIASADISSVPHLYGPYEVKLGQTCTIYYAKWDWVKERWLLRFSEYLLPVIYFPADKFKVVRE